MLIFHWKWWFSLKMCDFFDIFNSFSSPLRSSPTLDRRPIWIFCFLAIVYMLQGDSFPAHLSRKTHKNRSNEIAEVLFFFRFFSDRLFFDFFIGILCKMDLTTFSIFSIFFSTFRFVKDFLWHFPSRIFFALKKNIFHFFFKTIQLLRILMNFGSDKSFGKPWTSSFV